MKYDATIKPLKIAKVLWCTSRVSCVPSFTEPADTDTKAMETRDEHLPYDLKDWGDLYIFLPMYIILMMENVW